MDEAFIGPKKPGPRGRGAKGKAKVVIAVESRDKHAGFAVMRHVPSADSDQILSVAQDKILPASNVRTDGWRVYQALGSNGFVHESVIVSKDKEALKQLKWVHVLTANVKGNIRGVYHGVMDVLETLGCGWYTPGSVGEVVPRRPTLTVPDDLDHSEVSDSVNRRLWYGGMGNRVTGGERPLVAWRYNWRPEPGSEEALLYEYLKPRDWLEES